MKAKVEILLVGDPAFESHFGARVETSEQAIVLVVRSRPVKLIVLDLPEPLESLRHLKTDERTRRIPLLVLTDKDVRRAYELRANAVIKRPANLKSMEAVTRFWLQTASLPPWSGSST